MEKSASKHERFKKCHRLDKKCVTTVSPTDKGLTITPTAWQNFYFKYQITTVGLSGIALQIWQLDLTDTLQHSQRPYPIICDCA